MLCECKSARTWFLYLRIQVKFYSHVLGLPRYSDNFTSWSGSWLCILSKCYYYVIVIWSLLSLELLLKNSCQCTWRVHSFSVMSVESVDVIGRSLKALVFSRIWYILMLSAYTLWSLYQKSCELCIHLVWLWVIVWLGWAWCLLYAASIDR